MHSFFNNTVAICTGISVIIACVVLIWTKLKNIVKRTNLPDELNQEVEKINKKIDEIDEVNIGCKLVSIDSKIQHVLEEKNRLEKEYKEAIENTNKVVASLIAENADMKLKQKEIQGGVENFVKTFEKQGDLILQRVEEVALMSQKQTEMIFSILTNRK